MSKGKRFLYVLMAGLLIVGCREDLETTTSEQPPNLPVLPPVNSDIAFSATIDGQVVEWTNFQPNQGNGIDSTWYPVLDWCDSTFDVVKAQSFHFGNFSDSTLFNLVIVSLNGCAPIFTNDILQDSIMRVGSYGYASFVDTLEGVTVTWYDQNQKMWSTLLGDSVAQDQQNSTFTVTDLVENTDGFSKFLMAGTLQCVLFDTAGNAKALTDGQFVTRIGREY